MSNNFSSPPLPYLVLLAAGFISSQIVDWVHTSQRYCQITQLVTHSNEGMIARAWGSVNGARSQLREEFLTGWVTLPFAEGHVDMSDGSKEACSSMHVLNILFCNGSACVQNCQLVCPPNDLVPRTKPFILEYIKSGMVPGQVFQLPEACQNCLEEVGRVGECFLSSYSTLIPRKWKP